MQVRLCEDCMRVARGDDWTIVDQRTAQHVERWQTEHEECDIVPMFDTDTRTGIEASSGAQCYCCHTFQRGARYTFRVSTPEPAIMVAEGASPRFPWRQYFVVTDERCVCVEMLPATLCGWRFHRVMVSGPDSWPGCIRDRIVQWKLTHSQPIAMAPDLGAFRDKLLAVAVAGKIPERAE